MFFCPGLQGPRAAEGAARDLMVLGNGMCFVLWDLKSWEGAVGTSDGLHTVGDCLAKGPVQPRRAVRLLPFLCGRHTGSGRGQLWALLPSALPSCERVLHGHLEGVLGNVLRNERPAPNGSSNGRPQDGPGPHFRCLPAVVVGQAQGRCMGHL